jgi:short-subunit dehydrogenase
MPSVPPDRPHGSRGRGKLAIVTGASGGLGFEFAKLLAADGYDLALVARSQSKLEEIAQGLRDRHGIEATPVPLDLAAVGAAPELARRVPRCDVLVNNAGFGTNGRFDRIEEERIAQEVLLDVVTLTRITRSYLPGMIERGGGKILNVASTAGFLPGPFMAVYYASKAYVISFSQALAEEMRGTGVSVTCFCPGAIATDFAGRAGMKETLLFKLPVSSAGAMARAGYEAMQAGRLVNVPWPPSNWFVELSARLTPRRLLLWFSRKAVEVERA